MSKLRMQWELDNKMEFPLHNEESLVNTIFSKFCGKCIFNLKVYNEDIISFKHFNIFTLIQH